MILYFSATGNNKYCAEYIASKTGDKKIISLNDMIKNNVYEIDCSGEERLGIVAPTYDFDLAYVVADFLEGLEFQNVSEKIYSYGIITCGSGSGNSENSLREILGRKKINLNAAFIVIMPDNYVLAFKQKSPEKKSKTLAEADAKLKEISEIISAKKDTPAKKSKLPKILTWAVRKFFIPNKKPVWTKDNCACCLACIHRCPKQAINRSGSAKNGRYLNPNVKF